MNAGQTVFRQLLNDLPWHESNLCGHRGIEKNTSTFEMDIELP